MVHDRLSILIEANCLTRVDNRPLAAIALAEQVALRPQMVELLEIEDRTLSQQEVLSDILFVVSVFHLLLVNIINEFLYLILVVGTLELHRASGLL